MSLDQTMTLGVTNIQGLGGNEVVAKWTLSNGTEKNIKCNNGGCWENTMATPSNEGEYGYTLTYNGKTVCSGTIEVIPSLSCSVDKTTVGVGEEYTFSVHKNVHCWSCSYQYDNGTEYNISLDGIDDISKTKTATSLGSKTLNFSCTCNGSYTRTCTQTITVTEVAPQITCPANLTGVALNSNVSVTPQSLTGCGNGCNYTIDGTSATGSGYTGGALSFTGESTAGEYTYTFNVNNTAGADACEFTVAYDASAPVCHCEDYCGTGCESNVMTGNIGDKAFNGCLFITDATRLSFNTDNGGYWKVNGSTIDQKQPCWDNSGDCSKFLDNYPKVDGGWYIQGNVDWASVHTSTVQNPCEGSGGGSVPDPDPGSGGDVGNDPISIGTYTNEEIRKNDYVANTWYSLDVGKDGSLVMQNHSGSETSLTYKDCSGSEQTKLIKTGQNGDAGSGWWNSLGTVNNGCKIVFKFSSNGDFAIQIW